MTDWNSFTDAELNKIADQVWGEGRYAPGIGQIDCLCPKCGATATILASEIVRAGPKRFRATCTTCTTHGSGSASSSEMRRLESDEVELIVRRRQHDGLAAFCPVCQAPPQIEKLAIGGSSSDHFMVRCLRCGSHGQTSWPPESKDQ